MFEPLSGGASLQQPTVARGDGAAQRQRREGGRRLVTLAQWTWRGGRGLTSGRRGETLVPVTDIDE